MSDTLKPRDAREVQDAVAWALAHEKRLEVRGGGTKAGIGRPSQTDLTLNLSGLTGVTMYEPEELVLTARAGTPLAEIEALVASRNQELAFEPMDFGSIFGRAADGATIGGTLAANVSGPRRIRAGAARDHFLGLEAVSGRAETFKGGGRVVKNVTGYDMPKLLGGSWGTLAVMTEVTIKVLPRPETAATVLVLGLADGVAARAMAAAMGSPAEVSGAAHLPPEVAARSPVAGAGRAVTAIRLEGFAPSVAARVKHLTPLLAGFGDVEAIGAEASQALWRFVRDAAAFAAEPEHAVWRVSAAPSAGAAIVAEIARHAAVLALYDWAGGLVWLSLSPSDGAGEGTVRRAARAHGGQATLIRAEQGVRAAVSVFEPEAPALAALSKRVKNAFDPSGILNPGRMWAGV